MPRSKRSPSNSEEVDAKPAPQLACVVTQVDDVNYRRQCLDDAYNTSDYLAVTSSNPSALRELALRCDVVLVFVDNGMDTFVREIIDATAGVAEIKLTYLSAEAVAAHEEALRSQDLEGSP